MRFDPAIVVYWFTNLRHNQESPLRELCVAKYCATGVPSPAEWNAVA